MGAVRTADLTEGIPFGNPWLGVARMSSAYSNGLVDQYEQDVDEIVAACDGDLRGAVKALMLANEQLEQRLWLMRAQNLSGTEINIIHGRSC